MNNKLTGFDVSKLNQPTKKLLVSLIAYVGTAGVKTSEIKTKTEFWSVFEKIYRFKVNSKNDDETAIILAYEKIFSMSRAGRRRLVKEFKSGPVIASRKKIMAKLEKENESFYTKLKFESHPSKAQKDEFYKTWDWQKLRIKTFEKYGRRCMCCGATNESIDMTGRPVQIVVDHVKPLHNYWSMRLNENNTQILCFDCNMGKGIDETDYRPKPVPDEWIIEDEIPEIISEQLKIRH